MPSRQRVADAAVIAPFLTHVVSHHGQLTLIPPENTGRVRKAKVAKKTRARPDRNVIPDDEPRFNIGTPRPSRSQPTSPGRARRPGRGRLGRGRDEEYNEESIPDYPPPSFQEAISTPVAIVIPTPSSAQFSVNPIPPALRLQPPSPPPSPPHPQEPPMPSPTSPLPHSPTANPANSGSETDTSSIEIVELEPSQTQWDEDRTLGLTLDERVKREGHRQRLQMIAEASTLSLSSPGPSRKPGQSLHEGLRRSGRGVLESDSEPEGVGDSTISGPALMKRRHVSPLKPLSPSKPLQERAMSAHPSGSPYSFHLSPSQFFRSTTSLRVPLSSPVPSTRNENFVSRKLFLSKGKERARNPYESEPLDSWEVVDGEHIIPSGEATVITSPLHPVASWFTRSSRSNAMPDTPPNSPLGDHGTSTCDSTTFKPFAEHGQRDRKGIPPISFLNRPVRRPPPPPAMDRPSPLLCPPSAVPTSESPVTPSSSVELPSPARVGKKGRPPPPPPPRGDKNLVSRPSHIPPLPLRMECMEDPAAFERALETPLPPTPTDMSSFDCGHRTPTTPTIPTPISMDRDLVHGFASVSHPGPPSPNLEWESRSPFADHYSVESEYHGPSLYTSRAFSSVRATSPLSDSPSVRAGRHYPGRPLPRPPPIPLQADIQVSTMTGMEVHLPEELLADLRDDGKDVGTNSPTTGASAQTNLFSDPETTSMLHQSQNPLQPLPSLNVASSPPSPVRGHTVTSVRQPLPPYNSPPLSLPSRTSPQGALSNITDLDALLSEIGENRNGSDYEALLLVSEFVGPSTPANGNAVPSPDPKRPLSSLLGKIELDRRRVTKDGRVKLKLSLLGTTVDRCGICLSQFKEGELATLGATCQHALHERCLRGWLVRSRTCPMCRVPLDAPDS